MERNTLTCSPLEASVPTTKTSGVRPLPESQLRNYGCCQPTITGFSHAQQLTHHYGILKNSLEVVNVMWLLHIFQFYYSSLLTGCRLHLPSMPYVSAWPAAPAMAVEIPTVPVVKAWVWSPAQWTLKHHKTRFLVSRLAASLVVRSIAFHPNEAQRGVNITTKN